MTAESRAPKSERPMVDGQTETTPWDVALERLEHPAPGQNHWLATVRPDGGPHLMPIIAFWIDGAFHFLAGEGTRKGRNLAADERCVIGTGNLTLPSMDLIVEGRARPDHRRGDRPPARGGVRWRGLAARGARQRRLRPAWPDGGTAALRDLPARADEGVRPARDVRNVRGRPAPQADALDVRARPTNALRGQRLSPGRRARLARGGTRGSRVCGPEPGATGYGCGVVAASTRKPRYAFPPRAPHTGASFRDGDPAPLTTSPGVVR